MSYYWAPILRRQAIVYRLSSIVFACWLLSACASTTQPASPAGQVSAIGALSGAAAGFARATAPREFVFPRDHGPHQEYAIEWWYYTGNLDTAEGRHFGFQLTFFRFGLDPRSPQRASDWATSNIYMAHFALSDIGGRTFYSFDRFSRGAAGLAGAQGEPFRVWLEDWSASSDRTDALPMRLQAAQGGVSIDLMLERGKPVVLQGDRGLSQKSGEVGNASYYYSLTRMPTRGTVRVAGQAFNVSGQSWMDREWSTSSLGPDIAGWDWFALQLADGREVMYYQLREKSGGASSYSGGTLVAADGSARHFGRDAVQLEVLGEWQSPRSGGRYPSGWRMRIPSLALDLKIAPYLADQELALTTVYWEGAARIEGTADGQPIGGNGYVELTGYGERQGELRVR